MKSEILIVLLLCFGCGPSDSFSSWELAPGKASGSSTASDPVLICNQFERGHFFHGGILSGFVTNNLSDTYVFTAPRTATYHVTLNGEYDPEFGVYLRIEKDGQSRDDGHRYGTTATLKLDGIEGATYRITVEPQDDSPSIHGKTTFIADDYTVRVKCPDFCSPGQDIQRRCGACGAQQCLASGQWSEDCLSREDLYPCQDGLLCSGTRCLPPAPPPPTCDCLTTGTPCNKAFLLGTIFGPDDVPLEGIVVKATTNDECRLTSTTTTAERGSYTLAVMTKAFGQVSVVVTYLGSPLSATAFTYRDAVFYNWRIKAQGQGYVLVRK